jgi:hypothetical protein
METFERFQIIDDNFGGPLVLIKNNATGEECWAKRSRLRRVDGAWMILTDREHELLMATRKRRATGELAMTGPSKTLRTSTSGGR